MVMGMDVPRRRDLSKKERTPTLSSSTIGWHRVPDPVGTGTSPKPQVNNRLHKGLVQGRWR